MRGGFPVIAPADDAPPELDRFVGALRRLHDLTVSSNPAGSAWADAAQHLEEACALLDGHHAPQGVAPAGRVLKLPGLGHPLPQGHFSRSHVSGNNAVHGGMIPLLYDWLFRMVFSTAGVHPTRTAHLHVDYRSVTPIDEPLTAHGRITDIDGRKVFISASMTSADGTLLSEANGLMVRLLPHQP
jgi:acyl-coenzyme A thioesterase PaaI-like protein